MVLPYCVVPASAVVAHNVADVQLLVRTLLSCRIWVVRLVLLIVEILIMSLCNAPNQQGCHQNTIKASAIFIVIACIIMINLAQR